MELINNKKDLITLLQKFIDSGCIVYGPSVFNFLVKHKTKKFNIYLPTQECIEEVGKYKTYFECLNKLDKESIEIKQVSKNKSIWRLKDTDLLITTKMPNPKHLETKICFSKDGISFLGTGRNKSIEVLKFLRKFNKKQDFNDEFISLSLEWINYLIQNDNFIYGGWPVRYITSIGKEIMNRDIDILCDSIQPVSNLMNILKLTGVCDIDDQIDQTDKYSQNALKIKLSSKLGILNMDVHKNSKDIDCDAFYNNLRLTKNNVTINYLPDDLSFISAFIMTMNDVFNKTYTLMKKLPTEVKNNSDFRLIARPIQMSTDLCVVDYSYLESKYNDIKKITAILSKNGKGCNEPNHQINQELHMPDTVINMNKKRICLHCLHASLQPKKKQDKDIKEDIHESESESDKDESDKDESDKESS
ncbi:hypothetical protein QKU48_gp1263 [Fadolivirus algeromassiliense]|jgi:hypothetical protein|uniref:Uncharacterized protein n=1 Tax=Fadolivirus FV1/VV64 TaxID=3070911 RepID=A0A7D3R200_9VIRU|nr:hypothetical protein QKU48_gp1263 [Fadolivirus algeromassiliense]QKF94721.1 hypothetical protein Fadolivirus_1_1263 [Fadolivirus FV1/VV64]